MPLQTIAAFVTFVLCASEYVVILVIKHVGETALRFRVGTENSNKVQFHQSSFNIFSHNIASATSSVKQSWIGGTKTFSLIVSFVKGCVVNCLPIQAYNNNIGVQVTRTLSS